MEKAIGAEVFPQGVRESWTVGKNCTQIYSDQQGENQTPHLYVIKVDGTRVRYFGIPFVLTSKYEPVEARIATGGGGTA